jgi:type III secretory pathway lipoprotein EscJ
VVERVGSKRAIAAKRVSEALSILQALNVPREQQNELKDLFKGVKAGLVFVTAFLTRRAMTKYLSEIAWETR